MKAQLKSIIVWKPNGKDKFLPAIRSTKMVDDINAFRETSKQYFTQVFGECVVTLNYKEIK